MWVSIVRHRGVDLWSKVRVLLLNVRNMKTEVRGETSCHFPQLWNVRGFFGPTGLFCCSLEPLLINSHAGKTMEGL